jgi:hypothetical protein
MSLGSPLPHTMSTQVRRKISLSSPQDSSPSTFDITPVTQWAISTLEGDLTCSICLELFTNPVGLPCGHNMCKTCWESMQNFKCPICRNSCNVSLEINQVLNTLVGVFPISTTCGLRMLKRDHEAHVMGCSVCSAQENKFIRSQLANTRRRLLKLRKRRRLVVEESDDSDDDDDDE